MKSNHRRLSCLVSAQTLGNLFKLATMAGYGKDLGRVVDKLVREKMIQLREGATWRPSCNRNDPRRRSAQPSSLDAYE